MRQATIRLPTAIFIEPLNLSHNCVGADGARALAQNHSLLSLNACRTELGDAGACALARHRRLTTLNVAANQIGVEGAVVLANSRSLVSLSIENNQIGNVGARAFTENTRLKVLKIGGNRIGDDVMDAIEKRLKQNNHNPQVKYVGSNKNGCKFFRKATRQESGNPRSDNSPTP